VLRSGICVHSSQFTFGCRRSERLLENGVPPYSWDGESGNLELDAIPAAVRRLILPDVIRIYDQSSVGYRTGTSTDEVISSRTQRQQDSIECFCRAISSNSESK
jgi:hypothetical protein